MTTDAWGVDDGYLDVAGTWHHLGDDQRAALRAAMRCDEDAPPEGPPLWFVTQGDGAALLGPCDLNLEDGSSLGTVTALPPDLPVGWHRLVPLDGGPTTTLAIRPRRVAASVGLRAWLWSTQLYATRSARSWGIGDLVDLAATGRLGRTSGASFTGVNPLFDTRTDPVCEPSPYSPSSRRWLHPIWLRIEDVPGAAQLDDLDALARAGRALNDQRVIDRDAVWERKRRALERLWTAARTTPSRDEDAAFARWRGEQGPSLTDYARFRALADVHGSDWRRWPPALRTPDAPAVDEAASEVAEHVEFWAWLQWLLDRQLADAHGELPLLADLPVGVDPGGADAWRWQHLFASDTHVGAPPDELGPVGQDWGVAPFIPWALRAAHYEPIIEMIRAMCARAGAIRIDHVMGLLRLFWIPSGAPPSAGGYVRYRDTELLDVVLIEAARADVVVVGEDLGTVEPGVRELLADRGVLGTRLVWFEDEPPARYPESCLASISTHDLPTAAGLLSGADADDVRAAGVPVDKASRAAMRRRLLAAASSGGGPGHAPGTTSAPAPQVIDGAVRSLATSPAALVAVSLDDALATAERPNLPGTVSDQRPNWSLALPVPLEEIAAHPLWQRCAATLRAARPRPPT